MADNGTAASGPTIAWDDIGPGVVYQRIKVTWGVDGTAVDASAANPFPVDIKTVGQQAKAASIPVALASDDDSLPRFGALTETAPGTDTASSGLNGRLQRIAQRLTSLIALIPTSLGQKAMSASMAVVIASDQSPLPVAGGAFDVQASFTRPADTTSYVQNDAMSDSTSAPTAGGFTLTGVARVSGGLVMITDVLITSSKPSNLQGNLYLFNQAVTANNDNAAFAMSDSDVANAVAIIPFVLTADASNSWQHLQNLSITALCSGSANLRFLIKVTAAAGYAPDNAEVIKVRAKGLQLN